MGVAFSMYEDFIYVPSHGRVVYLIRYVGDSSSAKLHYISLTRDSLWDKCVVESSQKLCRYQSRKWKLWIAERYIVQWSKHKKRHDKLWPTKHYTKNKQKSSNTNLFKTGKGITLGYSSNVRVYGYQSRSIY